MSEPLPARVSPKALPALVAAGGPSTTRRFIDSLLRISATATHAKLRPRGQRTPALVRAHGVHSLAQVASFHVAAWIEARSAALTVKQRLAAIRHLFDWLVVSQIVPVHPASSVRGPKHIMRKGKTPALEPTEARARSIALKQQPQLAGRDLALIGLMVYGFAHVSAALGMKVEDVYNEHRRFRVHLREKGGKRHEMLCHHNQQYILTEHISKAPASPMIPRAYR